MTVVDQVTGEVHLVVPEGIDDPARRSGGNAYDRRVCDGLRTLGWRVDEHAVPDSWPTPTERAAGHLTALLSGLDDDAIVLLDGLLASPLPEVVVPQASRLRLVVLLHLPLGLARGPEPDNLKDKERAVLTAAAAVVTPSSWTRSWLREHYALGGSAISVAEPGVAAAAPAPGSKHGGELLCVGAVVPHKGHDLLLAALAEIPDLAWRCRCVGSVTRDPDFVDALAGRAALWGVSDRFELLGPRSGADLEHLYATADVLVLASRTETYGMVVTEALARGLPVVATEVGGVPEALGYDAQGRRPGLLVPPEDAGALACALRLWMENDDLRQRLRHSVRQRRAGLPSWRATAEHVSQVLRKVGP